MQEAPQYNKPDAPGVWMNFDNSVSILHRVSADDAFSDAAQGLFEWMKEAEERFPGWPRALYLDIEGHRGEFGGFDADFYEFQQEFLFSTMAPFLTALETPLTGALVNPEPQRNDLPDRLIINHEQP